MAAPHKFTLRWIAKMGGSRYEQREERDVREGDHINVVIDTLGGIMGDNAGVISADVRRWGRTIWFGELDGDPTCSMVMVCNEGFRPVSGKVEDGKLCGRFEADP
jgi:hypothetical protein